MLREVDGELTMGAERVRILELPCDRDAQRVPMSLSFVPADAGDAEDVEETSTERSQVSAMSWEEAVSAVAACVAEVRP